MENGLYVALSSQVALQKRLDTIADNMANSNTVGFRATSVKFEDLVSGYGQNSVAFASAGETFVPSIGGSMRETGNPLDFAIKGGAFFAIETPAGVVMTRDGRFSMLNNGDLVTLQGYPVLDAGEAPIRLDPQGGAPVAGADGTLQQNGNLVGAVGLFEFEPGRDFRRFGNSGFIPQTQPQPLVDQANVTIAQGYVEDSNVNPVQEMMRLIQVQRAFDNISALVRDSEGALNGAVRALGGSS